MTAEEKSSKNSEESKETQKASKSFWPLCPISKPQDSSDKDRLSTLSILFGVTSAIIGLAFGLLYYIWFRGGLQVTSSDININALGILALIIIVFAVVYYIIILKAMSFELDWMAQKHNKTRIENRDRDYWWQFVLEMPKWCILIGGVGFLLTVAVLFILVELWYIAVIILLLVLRPILRKSYILLENNVIKVLIVCIILYIVALLSLWFGFWLTILILIIIILVILLILFFLIQDKIIQTWISLFLLGLFITYGLVLYANILISDVSVQMDKTFYSTDDVARIIAEPRGIVLWMPTITNISLNSQTLLKQSPLAVKTVEIDLQELNITESVELKIEYKVPILGWTHPGTKTVFIGVFNASNE